MGKLFKYKVESNRWFETCGVDYAVPDVPVLIKSSRRRNWAVNKAYNLLGK